MGVEQGGDYWDQGGSYGGGEVAEVSNGGYYGGGGDIGDADFYYGYGAGESSMPPDTPVDWGFDTTSWPTLDQGSDFNLGMGWGEGQPVADSYYIDPSSGFYDMGGGYIYDPSTGDILDTGLQQGGSDFDNVWRTEYEGWLAFGVDPDTAAGFADQALEDAKAAAGVIGISQSATELQKPPDLPDLPDYPFYPLPFVDNYNPWQTPPYAPTFPEGPIPPPPPSPSKPTPTLPCAGRTANGYPPPCPAGTGRGPYGSDPCVCYPLATTNQQQQGPKQGQQAPPPVPKPPAQKLPTSPQGCPPGYTRDPATGQCRKASQQQQQQPARCAPGQYYSTRARRCALIPKCPTGFVFDPVLETCVRTGTQTSKLPADTTQAPGQGISDSLSELLKNTPWWLWGALLAALALSSGNGGEQRKRVTIQHRRAT